MDPFTGEVRIFCFQYAPLDWALCNGQALPGAQFQALYSIIGTSYGGSPASFRVPNLSGRAPVHQGAGPGLTPRNYATSFGNSNVTLTSNQMASHDHTVTAMKVSLDKLTNSPGSTAYLSRTAGQFDYTRLDQTDCQMAPGMIAATGASGPHENRQPYLALNFCICLNGEYPVHQ